jgi:pimeloyl-ACP methyl ester carboxylesterase
MKSNIVQTGSGPSLVLVHGLGGNLHSWDIISAAMEKRFTVLRYDLRGHGGSHNPPGPWQLDDFVDDLEEVLAGCSDDPVRLAGFSLGGLISQGYTLRHPAAVSKLVIISAVAGRTEAERQKVVERVRNLERGDLDTNIELALERWFSPHFREQHPDRVQARLEALKANDPGGYLNAYRVFGLGDLAQELHKIQCPTLVMTGEFDPGSNVRMAELMHQQIAGSKLEILPAVRHSVLVEAPQLVAQRLDEFL